ncbi:helix-turn-helix transcriptional regulator [Streptomyces sp. NPDC006285]|uniref:helix-turn-helix transcriptional regulator n=1 Tax=Streptomyces sp. NPDC006285 TaxID=3364742 RepID=UPI00367C09F5
MATAVRLVQRGGELRLLEDLLTDARQGRGSAAVLTGSPGTGKSAVLRTLAARATDAGALVLSACATEAETDLPLGVVGQLLSGTTSALGTAAGGTGPGGGNRPEALHDALRSLGAGRPLVVTVDDVHHTDEPSARCLLYLCGRLTAAGVLVVLAGHPQAAPSLPLGEVLRHPRCVPVPLRTLSEDGVAEFLRVHPADAVDPAAAGRQAPDWHRFTGGNPRLLHGLLADHRECGPVRPARPVAGTAFRRAVAGCLPGPRSEVTRTAHALAVLADQATLTVLARFLGVPERAVGPCLAELAATGLLDAGRLRHQGVSAAVLGTLAAKEGARLHARAARVLYDAGAEPPAVARHLVAADAARAADGGAAGAPPWAVPLLAEAARQAMPAGQARRAAEFLRTAHRLQDGGRWPDGMLLTLTRAEWESDPASVIRHLPALERDLAGRRPDDARWTEAAGLLLWHGRYEPVAGAVADASAGASAGAPVREVRAALGQLRPGAVPGTGAPGADAVERVLESVVHGLAPPPSVPALLLALLSAGETDRAAQWCELTAGPDPAAATPARQAVAAALAAVLHVRTGLYEAGARHAARALALLSPAAWGVAVGVPLAAAVRAATARQAHDRAAGLLDVPVPETMFTTRAGLHYLLARGGHLLAVGRARTALADFYACRDLLADWGEEERDGLGWRTPADEALRRLGDAPDGDPVAALTRAERRVVLLAAAGCTNRAIAARLYVTPSTVEQHLTHVYRKLRVRSRGDLAQLIGARAAEPADTAPWTETP